MATIMGTHNISEMLTADTIIHTKVVNQQGEKLGDIKDLAIGLEKGCINYAVLDEGGFLGMGGKYFAIPWQAFTVDQDNERLILNVSKDKLDNAPGFDKNHWPDFADQSWMQQTNDYYGYGTGSSGMGGGGMGSGGSMGGGGMGGGMGGSGSTGGY